MAIIEERTNKDGTLTYRAKVRLKGHPAQSASFARKTDAERWAVQTEAAIREGRHFNTAKSKRQTVADLIDAYLEDVMPTKGSQASHQTAQLAWWRERIGEYALSAVSPTLLAKCRNELLKGATTRGDHRSPATVRRYIAALSHAFTHAVRELEWLENNPVKKLSKPSEPDGRVRYLSDNERERFLAACKASRQQCLYTIVLMAISTGMRHAEILNLYWALPVSPPESGAWGVVDLDRKRVVLHQTKA